MNNVEKFTYIVNSVDENSGLMELTYSSPNLPDVIVGARMPRIGQDLDDVAKSFAPIGYWNDILNPIIPVLVGTSNTVSLIEENVVTPIQPITTGSQTL